MTLTPIEVEVGEAVHYADSITNVKKLSIEEIDDFLKSKSPKHKSRPF